jgi:hypothetical protein
MHHAADLEQRIQVSPQARGGGQFLQDLVRLEIENILDADLCRGLGKTVIELDGCGGRFRRILPKQEHED